MSGPQRGPSLGWAQISAVCIVSLGGIVIWLALSSADASRVRAQDLTQLRLATLSIHTLDAAARSGGDVSEAELDRYIEMGAETSWVVSEVFDVEMAANVEKWSAALAEETRESIQGVERSDMSSGAMNSGKMNSGEMSMGEMGHDHDTFADLDAALIAGLDRELDNAASAKRASRALSIITGAMTMVALLFVTRTRLGYQHRAELDTVTDRTNRRYRALVYNSSDMVFLIDAKMKVTYTTPNISDLFGDKTPANVRELIAVLPEDWREWTVDTVDVMTQDQVIGPLPVTNHAGQNRFVEIRSQHRIEDPDVNGIIVTARDVTDEVQLRTRLEHRLLIDDLTQLANRRAIVPRLESALSECAPGERSTALLMLDLDGFKGTNDTLGHAAGDALLAAVANRLTSEVDDGSLLARLGGDEFAVVIDDVDSVDAAIAVADRLRKCFEEPFKVEAWSLSVRTSIGVALTDTWVEPTRLLAQADLAMYEAKRHGRNRSMVFDQSMEHAVAASDRVYKALIDADLNTEFSLVYQPIFNIDHGELVSVEALLRWDHPELGSVSPAVFIPVAERSGEIIKLGNWVLGEACRQAMVWADEFGPAATAISVNVSAIQLGESDFIETFEAITNAYGVDPSQIVVEVTETALAEQTDALIAPLTEVRRLGFRVAMDDFGTGYSSLGQLRELPVDILKIDRSLVDPLSGDHPEDAGAIIEAIVGLATALGLVTVAEGIEDEVQLESLRRAGIHRAQGFHLARPSTPQTAMRGLPSPATSPSAPG